LPIRAAADSAVSPEFCICAAKSGRRAISPLIILSKSFGSAILTPLI
jgi:hypothetical protein